MGVERHPVAELSAAYRVTGATSGAFVAASLRSKQGLPRVLVARRDSSRRASTRKPYPTPRRLPPKRNDTGKRFSGAPIGGVDPTALPPAGRPPASCHHSRARGGFGHETQSFDRVCARADLSIGSCRGQSCDWDPCLEPLEPHAPEPLARPLESPVTHRHARQEAGRCFSASAIGSILEHELRGASNPTDSPRYFVEVSKPTASSRQVGRFLLSRGLPLGRHSRLPRERQSEGTPRERRPSEVCRVTGRPFKASRVSGSPSETCRVSSRSRARRSPFRTSDAQ